MARDGLETMTMDELCWLRLENQRLMGQVNELRAQTASLKRENAIIGVFTLILMLFAGMMVYREVRMRDFLSHWGVSYDHKVVDTSAWPW